VDSDPVALPSVGGRRCLDRICGVECIERRIEHGELHHILGVGEEEGEGS
jgi:hypothetical protein